MKKLSKILEVLKLKWLKETTLTAVLIAIIVALFVGINFGVEKLDPQDIDLTEEKLYTLTEESKNQISKIPKDDKFKIYMFDVEENSSVVDLAKQYSRINKNIEIEVVKTSNRLDLVSKYEVEANTNSILIISGEKHKLLTYYDLMTYDYNSGSSIDITEQRLTNSIIGISSIGTSTPVYVLKGHGEYGIASALTQMKTYLEIENYELKELDLLISENVPEDCSALVISTPTKDFADVEVQKITDYINKGGNILWMNDPFSTQENLPNVEKILELYGVTVETDGIILEQDTSKMVMQTPDLIVPNIESSTLAGDLSKEGTVMFLDSGRLKFVDDEKFSEINVTKTDLLTTSEKAFFRKNVSNASLSPAEGEEVGKQVVGAALTKTIEGDKSSKLVIFANNRFASDMPIVIGQQQISAIYLYNNLDLILNSVAFVSEKEDAIIIRKNVETTHYTATETQDIVVRTIIFGVPVLIILLRNSYMATKKKKKIKYK